MYLYYNINIILKKEKKVFFENDDSPRIVNSRTGKVKIGNQARDDNLTQDCSGSTGFPISQVKLFVNILLFYDKIMKNIEQINFSSQKGMSVFTLAGNCLYKILDNLIYWGNSVPF